MKALLWGLGAAGAPLTKPDQKKNSTKYLNDSCSSLFRRVNGALLFRSGSKMGGNEGKNTILAWSLGSSRQFVWSLPSGRPWVAVWIKDVTAHALSKNLNSSIWQLKHGAWNLLVIWGLSLWFSGAESLTRKGGWKMRRMKFWNSLLYIYFFYRYCLW